jgi:hypothetical protein
LLASVKFFEYDGSQEMNKPRKLLRHLGLYIGVVLVYTASTSAVAAECPNSLGFAKLASLENIYFGELHGTTEAPHIVRCVIEQKLEASIKRIVVSLELPDINSTDGKEHWRRHKDGKTSTEMWRLMAWLGEMEKSGRLRLHFISNDSVRALIEAGPAAFEKAHADEMKQILKDNVLIAYGGGFHSQKQPDPTFAPDLMPTGAYLGDLVTHVLLAPNLGGEAWYCQGPPDTCGVHQISPMPNMPVGAKPDDLIDGAAIKQDYLYLLGKVTASLPQNP